VDTDRTKQAAKGYFQDWTKMRNHKGKAFVANARLFKADKALYFPNLYGRTLSSPRSMQNTTTVLRGKISIVSLFSSQWAERQALSFVDPKQNPGLRELIKEAGGLAQRVEVNVEDNWLKAWLVRMFMWRTRRQTPREDHGKYFLVTKGFTEFLREQIGMTNSKVGYVYLLDEECKIRWAGSSIAESKELDALNAGVGKLVEDKKRALPVRGSKLTM
jgi:ATPase complex subunit ATP10